MSKASDFLVGCDDGHGILDPTGTKENVGKRTPLFPDGSYILEDEFNEPASNFFEMACKRCGFKTMQLAPEKYNVYLDERVKRANDAKCDIVVSWHFNAYNSVWDSTKGGVSIHVYPNTKDSRRLAECVHKYIMQGTQQADRGIVESDFQILRDTDMTAILIENGFMDVLKEAKLMKDPAFQKEQAEQACMGVCEYLGVEYVNETIPEPKPIEKHPIMGSPVLSAEQMATYLEKLNKEPKISINILSFCKLFLDEGIIEGVCGDKAFCQSMKETGNLKFGGQALPEQNNYAGIGVTNDSGVGKGAWFSTPKEGIRAQIQHLKAYASNEDLKNPCIDPRFNLVTRGIAPNWEDLNGRWAVPAPTYGQDIIDIFEKVKTTVPDEKYKEQKEPKEDTENLSFWEKLLKAFFDFLGEIFSKKGK